MLTFLGCLCFTLRVVIKGQNIFFFLFRRSKTQKRGDDKERRKRSPSPKPTKIHLGRLTRNVTKVSPEWCGFKSSPIDMCSCRSGWSVVDLRWLFVTPRLISFACFRITSRRFSPRMARSNQWKCQWTDCTPTCPGAPPTSSLRPLRRPRRPSSTWMEVVLLFSRALTF